MKVEDITPKAPRKFRIELDGDELETIRWALEYMVATLYPGSSFYGKSRQAYKDALMGIKSV